MKKVLSILMCLIIVFAVGCSKSGKKDFEEISKDLTVDEHSEVDFDVTGEIIRVFAHGDDVEEVVIAINGDEKYLLFVSECALSFNNNANGRDSNGNYLTQMPNNLEVGDNVRVTGGELTYREANEDQKYPYLVGFRYLIISKVK